MLTSTWILKHELRMFVLKIAQFYINRRDFDVKVQLILRITLD